MARRVACGGPVCIWEMDNSNRPDCRWLRPNCLAGRKVRAAVRESAWGHQRRTARILVSLPADDLNCAQHCDYNRAEFLTLVLSSINARAQHKGRLKTGESLATGATIVGAVRELPQIRALLEAPLHRTR
jgi:hypothetical protein